MNKNPVKHHSRNARRDEDLPDSNVEDVVTWEDTFAIARALKEIHTQANLAEVSLNMIYQWTLALPEFRDDPALANDTILAAIYQEWFEEVNPV